MNQCYWIVHLMQATQLVMSHSPISLVFFLINFGMVLSCGMVMELGVDVLGIGVDGRLEAFYL